MADKKVIFYDDVNRPPEFPCSSGRDLVPDYREVKPEGKESYLERIGESSMDDMIQSFAASVSLADKIARFQSGDYNALFSNGGFYADLTNAPTSLAEAVKIDINLAEAYDRLPSDVKEVFGDYDEFKKSAFDKTFDVKVAKYFARNAKVEEKKNETSEG